ncbi:MAG: M20/M25/M40 family metallo-hydrolase [Bacillota bacterium]|nr:M20/M25/M40 family metallo-hydrolase [Bacillota bacterium]
MDLREKLTRLSTTPGVSGFEDPVAAVVWEEFAALDAEVSRDRLGNVIALKRGEGEGPRPRVLLAAHLDEIGLIITAVEDDGFLRFLPVGGIDPRVLVAQEVVVHGRRPVPGIIGAKPPHIQDGDEQKQAYPREKLYIDVGLPAARAREEIRVGDPVTLAGRFFSLAGDRVAGKAFDDRVGVASLLVCLEELGRRPHVADVYAVATVGEETDGYRGATAAAFALAPDAAVAIDVDFAEEEPNRTPAELGKGPSLAIGPPVHPRVWEHFAATARGLGLPHQFSAEPDPRGTDAYALQVARAGVPTMLLGIPVRNMHTAVEVVSLADVEATGRLLAEAVARLDRRLVEGWQCF